MKKNLYFLASLSVCAFAAAHSAQAESPITCGYDADASKIHCTVTADQADVTKIELNAGDCYVLPPPAADMRQRYIAQAATSQPLSDQAKARLEQMAGQALSFMRENQISFEQESTVGGSTSEEYLSNLDAMNEGVPPALTYFVFNPVNKYHRGETFRILADGCSIWKWTITANGMAYDWKIGN